MSILSVKLAGGPVATALWAVCWDLRKEEPALGPWLQLCCFLGGVLLFPARFASRLLSAGLLQALLQYGNQIDYLGRLGSFLRFLFDFFSAGFHFFLDHFHKRFPVVVLVLFRVPFCTHAIDGRFDHV